MPVIGRVKTIGLDSETVGVDFYHGSGNPFFVTICKEESPDSPVYWEWRVNPLTRLPTVSDDDVREIQEEIDSADIVVGHNIRFDMHALKTIGITIPSSKVRCTLYAGHLLATNHPHNLTDMVMEYLGVNIEPLEEALHQAVERCRRLVKSKKNQEVFRGWKIAKEGTPEMPSARSGGKGEKNKLWKNDMWLPRAVADQLKPPEDHVLRRVLSDYSNADSVWTLQLWNFCNREIVTR